MGRKQKQLESEMAAADQRFVEHCRAHGLPVTEQRRAIFAALAASREHPSAEQLFHTIQHRVPKLSLATVYKNLEALRAIGAVSDVNTLHEQGRYEAALPGTGAGKPHHHLVCVSCKKVCDLHAAALDAVRVPRQSVNGFEVRAVRVQVEGLCPDCQRRPAAP
jgi:Fur family peroxide stress response transcriptional regulator